MPVTRTTTETLGSVSTWPAARRPTGLTLEVRGDGQELADEGGKPTSG
jgi:hypothetical protein